MKSIILCCLVLSVIIATVVGDESTCQTGDTKKQDCNNCRCLNGVWACSKKFCNVNAPRTRRGTVCTPGTTYKKDCNTCTCNKQGTNEACTLKACFSNLKK